MRDISDLINQARPITELTVEDLNEQVLREDMEAINTWRTPAERRPTHAIGHKPWTV